MIYYYDFNGEWKLENWHEVSKAGGGVRLLCEFEGREGDFILLWDDCREGAPWEPRIVSVNGADASLQDRFYIRKRGSRRGMPLRLHAGINTVTAEIIPREYRIENFRMSLIPAPSPSPVVRGTVKRSAPEDEAYPESPEIPHPGYRPGLGRENTPGRFGFLKSDGLLDCAMPWFGIVNKMFLCGHPRYRKPYAWTYSLRQNDYEGEGEAEVNPLSVRWRGGGTTYTYSLASGGIVTEVEEGDVRISKLQYAGNYRYVLTAGEAAALDDFSGEMPQNWLMLFGCSEFPDIPLLIVLERKPDSIEFLRMENGRLEGVVFRGCRKMVTATPFGFEALEPKSPADEAFLADAAKRCRFWSRSFLAYPVRCREYFRKDAETRTVHIVQEFEYRVSRDEWGTAPLYLAPLPPVLKISGGKMPPGALDFRFPTKYGPLYGFVGRSSAYSVDMVRTKRKFPLRSADSPIPDLLADGLQEYFDFESEFPDTIQSYAYPGAILEGYAYAAPMASFMPPEKRDFLAEKLSERLSLACDPDRRYTLLLTDHSLLQKTKPDREAVRRYYTDPALGKLRMFNLYERKEPFTGCLYDLCYFNVSMMSSGAIATGSREEVMAYPLVFVENDWGIGITFYMMYTAALFSGDWSAIRAHWTDLRKVFRFLDVFQDWACMGAAYAEKARTWVEGANFGAFTAFANIAETLGDDESADYCVYLGAKMLTFCRARFFSGPYFAHCYGAAPWYGTLTFEEEHSPDHNFQHAPDNLGPGRVRPCGVSLLTTDAVYPELFESFRETAPGPHRDMMNRYREALRAGLDSRNNIEFSYLLVNDALDPEIAPETVLENLRIAEDTNRLLRDWHDIHRFENFLPKNYLKAQILAWLAMRDHPIWLEDWRGMRIRDAKWEKPRALIEVVATEQPQILFCGIREIPSAFSFSGGAVRMEKTGEDKVEFRLSGSGVLELMFGEGPGV